MLGVEQLGAAVGFFDLGGDSIRSLQLVAGGRRGWCSARVMCSPPRPCRAGRGDGAGGRPPPEVAADAGTGEVVLTAMRRLLSAAWAGVTELSQSVLLVPGGQGRAHRRAAGADRRPRHVGGPEDHDGWRRRSRKRSVTAGELVRRVDISGWTPVRWTRRLLPRGRPRSGALPRRRQ